MINNPLLNGAASGPTPTCPTGWYEMKLPHDGYKGHSAITLQAADILRIYNPDLDTDPRVVTRLYHPHGDVAGLFTDRCEFRMLGKVGKCGKLMADYAGVAFLKGKIPWGKDPIALPGGTLLGAMGMKYYPFSRLTNVMVTGLGPFDMLTAMIRAYRADAMLKYGGLPVLGCPDGDVSALDAVRWPEGITVLATSEKLADQVANLLFEVEVEVWNL